MLNRKETAFLHATSHIQDRYQSWRNWNFSKKFSRLINSHFRATDLKDEWFVYELKILTADKSAHGGFNCASGTFGWQRSVEYYAESFLSVWQVCATLGNNA